MNLATSRTFSRFKTIQQNLLTLTSSSRAVQNTFSGSLPSYQSNKTAPVELPCHIHSCQQPQDSAHGFMSTQLTETWNSWVGKEPVPTRGEVSSLSTCWLSSEQPWGLLASSAARAGSWSSWCSPGTPVPSLQPIHEWHSPPCNPLKNFMAELCFSVGPPWN